MLKRLLYLLVFSLSLGQLIAISKSGGLNIYLFDLLIPIFDFAGIIYFLLHRSFKFPKYYFLFCLFILVALISLVPSYFILPIDSFFIAFSYWFRFVSYILSGTVVYNMLVSRNITKEELFDLVMLSGLFIAVAGFVQLVILPDFSVLDLSLGWDPHKNRLSSTFYDPNFVGAYLTMCMAFVFNRWFDIKKFRIDRYFLAFSIMLLALVLTFSRSAWLMFGVVVLVYGLFKSKKLLLVAGLIAFLAYFAVPRIQTRITGVTDPADSAGYRVISWSHTLDIIKDNFVLGVGFNTYRYAQIDYGFISSGELGGNSGAGSDASLLLVFATTGILGFVIFIAGLVFPLVGNFYKNNFLLSVISGLLFESIFINSLFYPQILFVLLIIFAMYSLVESKSYS